MRWAMSQRVKNFEENGGNRAASNMERLEQCGGQLKETPGHDYVYNASKVNSLYFHRRNNLQFPN